MHTEIEVSDQELMIAEIRKKISASQGMKVDVYYQQGIGTRSSEIKNAVIGPAYQRFFEIIVDVSYGTYKTTINYTDVYTHACEIKTCKL